MQGSLSLIYEHKPECFAVSILGDHGDLGKMLCLSSHFSICTIDASHQTSARRWHSLWRQYTLPMANTSIWLSTLFKGPVDSSPHACSSARHLTRGIADSPPQLQVLRLWPCPRTACVSLTVSLYCMVASLLCLHPSECGEVEYIQDWSSYIYIYI